MLTIHHILLSMSINYWWYSIIVLHRLRLFTTIIDVLLYDDLYLIPNNQLGTDNNS